MRNPTLLLECICKHDALYLKNFIERINPIHVEIMVVNRKVCLIVEDCNYHKSSIIVENQHPFLPSTLAKKHEDKMLRLATAASRKEKPVFYGKQLLQSLPANIGTICKYLVYLSIPAIC